MRETGPAAVASRSRRWWLLAVPWVVALVIAAAAVLPTSGTQSSPAGPAGARSGPTAAASAPITTAPAAEPTATADRAAAVTQSLDPATTARVLVATRRALGSHGLASGDTDARDRWVLDQLPADPVPTGADAVVVVVHATVITRTTTGWSGPTVVAAAVPVRLGPPVEIGQVELLPAGRADADASTDDHRRVDRRPDG